MEQKKDVNPMEMAAGQEADLMALDHGLKQMRFTAEWLAGDAALDYEIDLSAFLLNTQGQTRKDSDFIFYNNLQSQSLVVKHGGDAMGHNGSSEYIDIDLSQLSYEISEIVLVLSLHDGEAKDQSFNKLLQLSWRIANQETVQTVAAGQFAGGQLRGTALFLTRLKREGTNWTVLADGDGVDGGLAAIAQPFGLLIAGQ